MVRVHRNCEVCLMRAGQAKEYVQKEPHVTQHISLSLFTAHEGDSPSYYTFPCRCSGEFLITHEDLEAGVEVVGCGGCGEWVKVGYEVLEEDDEESTPDRTKRMIHDSLN